MLEKIKGFFKNFKDTKLGSFLISNKLVISLVALSLALIIALGVALNPLVMKMFAPTSSSDLS